MAFRTRCCANGSLLSDIWSVFYVSDRVARHMFSALFSPSLTHIVSESAGSEKKQTLLRFLHLIVVMMDGFQ